MRLVIVESPFANKSRSALERNIDYARAAVRDCLRRNESPLASHLLYTQPGVLNDDDAVERALGIEAGLAWGRMADATVVYGDLGVTRGMEAGIARALREGRPVEHRSLSEVRR